MGGWGLNPQLKVKVTIRMEKVKLACCVKGSILALGVFPERCCLVFSFPEDIFLNSLSPKKFKKSRVGQVKVFPK